METEDNRFVAECTTYDFKRELDRKKKNTWLKSVSAFANTTGGSPYFGVDNDGQVEIADLSGENMAMPEQSAGDAYMAQADNAPDYMNDANVGMYEA